MTSTRVELIACQQDRPYRMNVTLRLTLLDGEKPVLARDYTEPLGYSLESADVPFFEPMLERFRKRMEADVACYKASRSLGESAAMADGMAALQSAAAAALA